MQKPTDTPDGQVGCFMDTKKLENFQYIDSLRGWAVLGTFFVHLLTLNSIFNVQFPFVIERLLFLGQFGVGLFFIVSAYTLTRSIDLRGGGNGSISSFFIRRFFRIAPAYYLFLASAILIFPNGVAAFSHPEEDMIGSGNILLHLIFVNGFYPYSVNNILGVEWTIAVEVLFYCLLPFLFTINNKRMVVLFILSFAVMLVVPVMRKFFNIDTVYAFWLHFSLLEWGVYFILGILLYKNREFDIFCKKLFSERLLLAGGRSWCWSVFTARLVLKKYQCCF